MTSAPHALYLASAGTGKTYQLSNHYLRLLLAGVPAERILATTFTRKAAGEILDRVLERLTAAAEGGAGLADLERALDLGELDAARCHALLSALTRRLDRFQVRTIDAFFAQLARLFALDLELPADWSIVDDREDEEVRTEALQEVLNAGDLDELVELLREIAGGDAGRRVHEEMLGVVQAGRGLFLESPAGAWERIAAARIPSAEELAAALDAWRAVEIPLTKGGAPRANYRKACGRVLRAAEGGRWDKVLGDTLAEKLRGDRRFDRIDMPDELCAALEKLMDLAGPLVLGQLAARTAAIRRLLERFEGRYRGRKRDRGAYRFEDLPAALAPGASGRGPLEERELDLWFRLDARISHLLLDEFQDTAPVQWRILEPIAAEILADGTGERSFFCVGDVKQSIYGWRQAEPRLLAGLAERWPQLEPTLLARSYRSSQVVLDAVDAVFGGVDRNPTLGGEQHPAYLRAAEAFARGYGRHTAARELGGAVHLVEAAPRREGEDAGAPLVRRTVERVAEIVAAAPGASVGVLVRANAIIPRLIHSLRALGISASGEGGNPLTDSEAVLAYLSLLHLADHPDDSAAAFHVASTPLGEPFGLAADTPPEARRRVARGLRARLVQGGYGSLASEVLERVEAPGAWSSWDRLRFGQLVDLAYAFEGRAGLRPGDFAEHLRRERVPARGTAPVRVMSIHASKGLEFDAVVLPELQKYLVGQRADLIGRREDPYGWIDLVSRRTPQKLADIHPLLSALDTWNLERNVEEALCVLYVAMTRAARRLDLVVPHQPSADAHRGKTPTYAALLREALGSGIPDEGGLLWTQPGSGADWAAGLEALPEAPIEVAPAALGLAPTKRPRSRPRRTPSAEEGGGLRRPADLLAPARAASRGTLVHAMLEELEWLEDFGADDEDLLARTAALEPDERARRSALELMRSALEREPIRAALTRASCGAPAGTELQVLREEPFSMFLPSIAGELELWSGSIDRLVLARRDGAPIWAEVLDYKTDAVSGEELTLRAELYRPQLEGYRRAVAARFGLDPGRIGARLIFLSAGAVVAID